MLAEAFERLSFLFGLATGLAVVGIIYGLPRLIRGTQKWASAVLFSSLSGWPQRLAMASATLAVFWLFLAVGALYSPIAFLAPETLPTGGNQARVILALDLWILALLIPLIFSLAERIVGGIRSPELLTASVRGWVHLPAMSLAVGLLLCWLIWRRAFSLVARRREETYSVDIEVDAYPEVAAELNRRFRANGIPADLRAAPLLARLSRQVIDRLGPPTFRSPYPYSVLAVIGKGADLIIFTNLLHLSATSSNMGRARSAILNNLPPNGFWWTRSPQARRIEGAILGRSLLGGDEDIAAQLERLESSAEEWSALLREYLLMAAKKSL